MEIIFKLAGIGLVSAIVNQILRHCGKEEICSVVTIAGLVISLMMVLDLIKDLLSTVQTMFGF